MTRPDHELAALHEACFTMPRPWSAQEIGALLAEPSCFLLTEPAGGSAGGAMQGFLIGREAGGEAELLTLAVAPGARRSGTGRRLTESFLRRAAERGAETAFLEVAASNAPAIALYLAAGFRRAGLRRGYYRSAGGQREDALVLSKPLIASATGPQLSPEF